MSVKDFNLLVSVGLLMGLGFAGVQGCGDGKGGRPGPNDGGEPRGDGALPGSAEGGVPLPSLDARSLLGADAADAPINTGGAPGRQDGGNVANSGETGGGTGCGDPGTACCAGNGCKAGGCCVSGICMVPGGTCVSLGGGICAAGACGTCGGLGMPCCGSNPGVSSCTAPGTQCSGGTCAQCGVVGSPCCAGTAGGAPSCNGPGVICSNNLCVPCGTPGSACCPGSLCNSSGCCYDNICRGESAACGTTGGTCQAGRCSGCGGLSQPCCLNSCYDSLTCTAGTCRSCGNAGEPCCPPGGTLDRCRTGNACTSTGADGVCARCGSLGDACCAGNTCSEGCCAGGRCVTMAGGCSTGAPDAGAPDVPVGGAGGNSGTGGVGGTVGSTSMGGAGGVVTTATSSRVGGGSGGFGSGGNVGGAVDASPDGTRSTSDGGPTLRTLTFGERPSAMYQNVTADVDLQATNPTLNFGGSDDIASDGNPKRNGLIRFDLGAIDPSWTIRSATLYLWTLDCEGCSVDGTGKVNLFRVLEAWDEGTGGGTGEPGVANWNQRKAGIAWSSPGCVDPPCHAATAEATFQPFQVSKEYGVQLPTGLIRDWVTKPGENFGLAVRLLPVSEEGVNFWTRHYSKAEKRPLLTVDVSIP